MPYIIFQQNYQASAETSRLEEIAREGGLETAIDYCRIRNHLIMRVCIENRQRAGAISNMTVRGLEAARPTRADDGSIVHTITVASHKTAQSCGPATLGFDGELFRLLQGYLANVRTKFVPSNVTEHSGPLWLTLKGNKVSNKRISHCLQKAWKLTGQNKPVSTTILRKSAVSKTFEYNPNLMQRLGSHMSHSPAVQEKYYLISKKRNNTANMCNAIKRATAAPGDVGLQSEGKGQPTAPPGGKPGPTNTERRICLAGPAGDEQIREPQRHLNI